MISYSNQPFRYDHYEHRNDDESAGVKNSRRMQRTARRRSRKRNAATPGLTINGRRTKRWSW